MQWPHVLALATVNVQCLTTLHHALLLEAR